MFYIGKEIEKIDEKGTEKIHKSLHHMHVVDFEHVFEDHENVYILLEVC